MKSFLNLFQNLTAKLKKLTECLLSKSDEGKGKSINVIFEILKSSSFRLKFLHLNIFIFRSSISKKKSSYCDFLDHHQHHAKTLTHFSKSIKGSNTKFEILACHDENIIL